MGIHVASLWPEIHVYMYEAGLYSQHKAWESL